MSRCHDKFAVLSGGTHSSWSVGSLLVYAAALQRAAYAKSTKLMPEYIFSLKVAVSYTFN